MTRPLDACTNALGISREAALKYRMAMAAVVRSVGVGPVHEMDVVHNAFLVAIRKPKEERPDPKNESAFGAWLNTLAKYEARTNLRQRSRSRETCIPDDELGSAIDATGAYRELFDEKVDASTVFQRASREDGALLHEHFCEDSTISELAVAQEVTWTTMRERVDGALERVRTALVDHAPRSSRRRRIAALPFIFVGLVAREARAQLATLRARILAAFHRGPTRWLPSIGTAAAIFAAAPHVGAPEGDTLAAGTQSVRAPMEGKVPMEGVQCRPGVGKAMPAVSAQAPETPSPRPASSGAKERSSRRYQERSPTVWMISNAIRDADERSTR